MYTFGKHDHRSYAKVVFGTCVSNVLSDIGSVSNTYVHLSTEVTPNISLT